MLTRRANACAMVAASSVLVLQTVLEDAALSRYLDGFTGLVRPSERVR